MFSINVKKLYHTSLTFRTIKLSHSLGFSSKVSHIQTKANKITETKLDKLPILLL